MAELIAARRLTFCLDCNQGSDVLSVMNRMFAGWFCRDRFDMLNHHSCFRIKNGSDPIPQAIDTDMGELCDRRAAELIALGKPVVVLWSGGVDSTAILVSFLKQMTDELDLTVAYAPMTKFENPIMLAALVKDKRVKLEEHESIPDYIRTLSGKTVITGWCADQLFGSDVHRFAPTLYNEPWMDGIRAMMKARGIFLTERSFDLIESEFSRYAANLGVELTRFCEFAWLYNFGVKWSFVRDAAKLVCHDSASRDGVVNFFEAMPFQEWSMANFHTIKEHNTMLEPMYYKRPLKQYIFEYNQDENYLLNKPKVNSRSSTKAVDTIGTRDTDGYHVFKLKDGKERDMVELTRLVAQKYLKEEYL